LRAIVRKIAIAAFLTMDRNGPGTPGDVALRGGLAPSSHAWLLTACFASAHGNTPHVMEQVRGLKRYKSAARKLESDRPKSSRPQPSMDSTRPGADVSRSLAIGPRADVKEIFNVENIVRGSSTVPAKRSRHALETDYRLAVNVSGSEMPPEERRQQRSSI